MALGTHQAATKPLGNWNRGELLGGEEGQLGTGRGLHTPDDAATKPLGSYWNRGELFNQGVRLSVNKRTTPVSWRGQLRVRLLSNLSCEV